MRYVCFYKILIVTLFPLLLQGMETLQEYHVRCALKELGISPFLKKKRYKVKKKEGDQPEEWQHMVDMLMSNDNTTNNDDDSADNNDAEGNQSLSEYMLDFETLPIVTWQEVLEYKEQNPLSDEIRKKVEIQGQVLLDKKTLKEHSNRKIIKHKKIMKIRKKL